MVIHTKDVMFITRKSERTSRNLLNAIREKLGKEKHQMVSVREFCEHTRLREEEVLRELSERGHR